MFEYTDAEGEYRSFLSLVNFQLAWRRAKNSNQRYTRDQLGLTVCSAQTDEILNVLSNQVKEGKFTPQPPTWLFISKPDSTLRPFPLLTMEERIVYHAIGNIIVHNSYGDIAWTANQSVFAHLPTPPNIDGTYSDFMFLPAFSNRVSQDQHKKFLNAVAKDILEFSEQEDIWFIETDINSFYPSVDHKILVETLQERGWIKSPQLLHLLETCLEQWSKLSPRLHTNTGLPIGYDTSDLLATLLLIDIDKEMPQTSLSSRRFVDDMYYFVKGRRKSGELWNKLQTVLHKRGLSLNREKTKRDRCTAETHKRFLNEIELQKQTSFIEEVVERSHSNVRQERLLNLLQSLYSGDTECSSEGIEQFTKNAKYFAFILNRLNVRIDWLKENAICMLEEIPYLSYYATKYLGLFFEDDPRIADIFLEHASNSNSTPEKRVNCIRALIRIGYPFEPLMSIVRHWFDEDDFQLHYGAVDILAEKCDDIDFWLELASSHHSVHIRARAFSEVARLVFEDEDYFVSVVNKMWRDSSLYIRLMGIFFRRRQLHIPSSKFDTDPLTLELSDLFFTLDEKEEHQNFYNSFAKVFGFELGTQVGLERKLDNVKQTTQLLVNVSDSATYTDDFFTSFWNLVHKLLIAITLKLYPNHDDFDYLHLVYKLHAQQENAFSALSSLYIMYEKATKGNVGSIEFYERKKAVQRVRNVIALDIAGLHEKQKLPVPFSLELYTQNWRSKNPIISNKVFISYSHKDLSWRTKLVDHLTPLIDEQLLDVWVDTRIKPSDQWLPEIKTALAQSKVVVMLVSRPFLASPFIRKHEFLPTLKEARTGGKKVIWILISSCLWDETPIRDFQAAHDTDAPLDTLDIPQQNRLLSEICKQIKQAALPGR